MTNVEEAFLVFEYLQPCMLQVSVLAHEKTSLPRGVAHTLELKALETKPCIDEGDIVKFYFSGTIGETSWRDNPKYCEFITRENNVEKEKVPPGMLYFDMKEAKQGVIWASETTRNNILLSAEIQRQEAAGNYGADILWDELLKKEKGEEGSD